MTVRTPEAQEFLDAVRAGFAESAMDADTRRCLEQTFLLLRGSVGQSKVGGRRLPGCSVLPEAIANAKAATPALARIAAAFEPLEPMITWSQRQPGPNASANLLEGHANAMVVGPGGLEERNDAWVGLSLLAPDVRYPDHTHAPEEVYLLLSRGEFFHGDGTWFEPGFGGSFYNSPGILHSMRSVKTPLLAVWCLRPNARV